MPDSQGPLHTSGLSSIARGLQPAPMRLDGGRKLVCFDFGSMAAVGLPGGEAHVVAAARGALERLGMYGVLLTGVSHPAHAGCLITRLWSAGVQRKDPVLLTLKSKSGAGFSTKQRQISLAKSAGYLQQGVFGRGRFHGQLYPKL